MNNDKPHSNDTFIHIPGVKEYLERKESNLRSKYFKKYRFINQTLSLVLIFQSEALKHVRETYGITNSDFKVLCAVRLYKASHTASFRPYQLSNDLKGMWVGQLYKSIRRLERKGFIGSHKGVGFKSYHITKEGESCLKSYAKVFDEVFSRHLT